MPARRALFLSLIVLMLALTGCGANPTPQPTVEPPTESPVIATELPTATLAPTVAASPTTAASDTPAAPAGLTDEQKTRAEELLNTACAACHSPSRVSRASGSSDQWLKTIQSMQAKGAVISSDDSLLLAEYLAQTYP